MPSADEVHADIAALRERAAAERRRAVRAAGVAGCYEGRAMQGPSSLWAFRSRMADLHRRSEERHLSSARLQEMHADHLQAWVDGSDDQTDRPTFISVVAAALDVESAAMTLVGAAQPETLAACSDGTAQAARDLELVVAEGPISDATATGSAVYAAGPAMTKSWPRYGPAVAELGVYAVIASPLRLPSACLGALCAYATGPAVESGVVARTSRLADALTHTVLTAPGGMPVAADPLRLFDDSVTRAVVHQAAGMVSVQTECKVEDAIAMLRARAFADGVCVDEVALHVVRDGAHLF